MQGKIVAWDLSKYYGFIKTKDSDKKIFFHGQAVLLPPGEIVVVDDDVEFDLAPDRRHPEKPPLAINVKVMGRKLAGASLGAGPAERPRRYMRTDLTAEDPGGRGRHLRAAEALFGTARLR